MLDCRAGIYRAWGLHWTRCSGWCRIRSDGGYRTWRGRSWRPGTHGGRSQRSGNLMAVRASVRNAMRGGAHSQRRACGLVGLYPKTYRYASAAPQMVEELIGIIEGLAESRDKRTSTVFPFPI